MALRDLTPRPLLRSATRSLKGRELDPYRVLRDPPPPRRSGGSTGRCACALKHKRHPGAEERLEQQADLPGSHAHQRAHSHIQQVMHPHAHP